MRATHAHNCDSCAEPILSGEWRTFPLADPRRRHIRNCAVCRDRVQEVRFFGEVFSSDEPNAFLEKLGTTPILSQVRRRREVSWTWLSGVAKWSAVAAAACFVAVLIWNQFQPEGIGRVAYVKGAASVQRFGSRDRISLKEGAQVYLGDMIRTDPSSSVGFKLEESNLVYLNESTELRVEGERLLHHNQGEVWLDVGKGQGEFEVEARGADVLVTGTSFGIKYVEEEVLVPVASGRVRLMTKGGQIDLEPGHVGAYSSSQPFLPPHRKSEIYPDDHPGWIAPQQADTH